MRTRPSLHLPRFLTLRTSLFLVLAAFALVALAGCGPRAGGLPAADRSAESDVVVDLPAIYIDFDANGGSSIGGMSVSQAAALIGQSIPDLSIDPATVKTLMDYNIQHIQLVNTDKGLDILVDGLKVPSLGWNEEILSNLSGLLGSFGADLGPVSGLLPLLGNFNTGIVFRFPVAEGKEAMPLMDPQAAEVAQRTQEAAAAFSAGVGEAAVIKFAVDYTPDGMWTVQGRNAEQWEEVLPIGWDGFNLDPKMIQGVTAAGVKTVGVVTNEQGINMSINGKALPTITWGSGEVTNILRLLEQSGVIEQLTGGNSQLAGMLDLVEQLMPTVQAADFNMTVNFPAQ